MTMQIEMNTPSYLPSELIIEILLRLPVKSLICFKCVCKSWFSLISHPNFANSHFQITSANRIMFIPCQCSTEFHVIDFEINRNSTRLNNYFLRYEPSYSYYQIKGSCRGFIFLHGNLDIWIWNPSSRIYKQIPLSPFHSKSGSLCIRHLYGFGYDHSRDDYLVVVLTYGHKCSSHLEFFSLIDNMWNEIEGTRFTYLSINGDHTCGSFVSGAIHWLAAKSCDLGKNDIIVAFDLIERKLFEMPIPDDFPHRGGYHGLWVFGEFLSLCAMDYIKHIVEIWVMKEYKQHSSWNKTIVIDACWFPLIKPVCRTKNGDIIGKDGDRLLRYNDKGQRLEYLPIDTNATELTMYTESLFSLPSHVMKPKEKEVLKVAYESAKQVEEPHNMHEGDIVNNNAETKGPRKGMRPRKPHSMWKEYVKE